MGVGAGSGLPAPRWAEPTLGSEWPAGRWAAGLERRPRCLSSCRRRRRPPGLGLGAGQWLLRVGVGFLRGKLGGPWPEPPGRGRLPLSLHSCPWVCAGGALPGREGEGGSGSQAGSGPVAWGEPTLVGTGGAARVRGAAMGSPRRTLLQAQRGWGSRLGPTVSSRALRGLDAPAPATPCSLPNPAPSPRTPHAFEVVSVFARLRPRVAASVAAGAIPTAPVYLLTSSPPSAWGRGQHTLPTPSPRALEGRRQEAPMKILPTHH